MIPEAAINAEGVKPPAPYFEQIDSLKDAAGLPTLLARLHRVSVGALFNFDVDVDEKNSGTDIAQLYQGGIGMPDRDYYLLEDHHTRTLRQQYEQHLTKMFTLLGDPADEAAVEARTVLGSETELAKASKTRVDLRDPQANYHKMTVADLDKAAPGFDWMTYFTTLGRLAPGGLDVGQPDFVAAAVKLAASTPPGDLKTHLRWQLIHKTAAYLSQPFVDEDFAYFSKTFFGQPENEPRWKRVSRVTSRGIGQAVGSFTWPGLSRPKPRPAPWPRSTT